MQIVMVYPHHSSEKGISKYSLDIIENVNKQGKIIEGITYSQGKPLTLLKKIFKISKYDVIHIQHEYNLLGFYGIPYFILFFYLWIFRKSTLITTMHTVLSQEEKIPGNKLKILLRKKFYIFKNWLIRKSSDKVVVHSKYFKKILINEYNFQEKKVIIVPHGIIENIKTASKKKARKELGLSGKVYLMIGTMNPYHDYESVVQQANKVGKTILIVTSTSAVNYRNIKKLKGALDSLKKLVKRNNLEKFVRLEIGFIRYDKWWKYFSAADLILLPYKGGVGSGIFSDAMAMKKPVVASNVPYFSSIKEDYGCLKIAKTSKEFPKIINEAMSPKNYKKMLTECKRYLKDNGLTPVSKKYKELYLLL